MPCNTVQRSTVRFSLKTDRNLLVAALEQMGERPVLQGDIIRFRSGSYDCRMGEMVIEITATYGQDVEKLKGEKMNEVKRAYSAQVVQSQARRFGWTLKETGKYQYQVLKR